MAIFPKEDAVQAHLASLGLNNSDTIVCYDTDSMVSSVYVYWLLKTFGHDRVFVLDGGLQACAVHNVPMDGPLLEKEASNYKCTFNPAFVSSYDAVFTKILHFVSSETKILDTRPVRFYAVDIDSDYAYKDIGTTLIFFIIGHITGSVNIRCPCSRMLSKALPFVCSVLNVKASCFMIMALGLNY